VVGSMTEGLLDRRAVNRGGMFFHCYHTTWGPCVIT